MKVTLTHDTIVRMKKGTVLDLPEEEAKRLKAFNNAVDYVEPKQTKKSK